MDPGGLPVDLTGIKDLAREVAEREDALLETGESGDAIRARIAAHAGRPRRSRRTRVNLFLGGLAAVLAVALVVSLELRPASEPPALSYVAGDALRSGATGQWHQARDADVALRFSEGSLVSLHPGARARVTSLSSRGAELSLSSGSAHLDVVPRSENAWRLQSGPFTVEVKGTEFDVSWDPNADQFELALTEGRVLITGCGFGSGRALRTGQVARASCRTQTVSLSAIGAPAPEARVEPVSAEPVSQVPEDPEPAAKQANLAPPPAWMALSRQGHYQQAYALLEPQERLRERQAEGAARVLLLGETARLSGHGEDARLSYEAVRARFRKSRVAAQAAFQLGRLADGSGRPSDAARWFETYLTEDPGGPMAAAALGRLLESRVALGQMPAAVEAARTYLKKYPAGAHADAARKVLSTDANEVRP